MSTQIVARLFDGNQASFAAWLDQSQTRAEANVGSTVPTPLQLPSTQPKNHDNATETFNASMMQLCTSVAHAGFAFYEWTNKPADANQSVFQLLQALSLHDSDQGVMREVGGLSLLQDLTGTPKGRFPPYQPKAMNWHTDGYYNDVASQVRSFSLHCIAPAAEGGALLLMDDALLVFALLQEDPELGQLLSHPEAMTLPRNKDNQGHDRPDRCVPVILRNSDESIAMRFTTRTQNIQWRCNATQAAAIRACELIRENQQWHTRITLQKGQGIITRNVLHTREKFVDAAGKPKRQMLRGRFTSLPTPAKSNASTHNLGRS